MAPRKSRSVARSAPRAETSRVAGYAARLDEELSQPSASEVGALEAVMGQEKLIAVGRVMLEFAVGVACKGRVAEREERFILPSESFPPMA